MRHIDIESWERREQYRLYRHFDQPHFNMCVNVDVTTFYAELKKQGAPFTAGVLYVLARAANDIPAFRCRIREDKVVEHEVVHPGTSVISDAEQLGFCTLRYTTDFATFASTAARVLAAAKKSPSLEGEPGRDDVLYTTSIPWVSFTSFAHPMHFHPVDCIPRMAWGKRFEEGGRLKMPLSVQGHHALMDGVHMGRYYGSVQAYLADPQVFLSSPV
jgi:chloramphenicol O-acetyltransferase type A